MCAINLPTNQPSNRSPYDNVRRKMLLPHDTRRAYSRGQSVCRNLSEWAWIFVRDDAGDGPGYGGMVRRKRIAMLKKVAEPLALVGTFSSKRVLECGINCQTIDCSFS